MIDWEKAHMGMVVLLVFVYACGEYGWTGFFTITTIYGLFIAACEGKFSKKE